MRLTIHRPGRPGLRAAVLAMAAGVIVTMSFLVSNSVADHVTMAAQAEAIGAAETLIRGDMDGLLTPTALANPTADEATQINDRLVRLTSIGHLLRIKVWTPTATIQFSDAVDLRGRAFPQADDLKGALAGTISAEIAPPIAPENVDEAGLAAQLLQIYLPIHDPVSGKVIGSYEVYQDAAPIQAHVAKTRTDVLLVVAGASVVLLGILYGAFSLTSRRLARQNRQLVEQANRQEILATDLRRSEERFRSLVQNSADVILVATPAGVQAHAQLRFRHANGGWRVLDVAASDHTEDPAVSGIVLNYHDVTDRSSWSA